MARLYRLGARFRVGAMKPLFAALFLISQFVTPVVHAAGKPNVIYILAMEIDVSDLQVIYFS